MYGGELPFTGSILTLPLVAFGLILSVAGWILGRRNPDEQAA
jgi:LPXTG-motif cell wall-anchored protein